MPNNVPTSSPRVNAFTLGQQQQIDLLALYRRSIAAETLSASLAESVAALPPSLAAERAQVVVEMLEAQTTALRTALAHSLVDLGVMTATADPA